MREDLAASREAHIQRLRDALVPLYPTWRGRTHTAADIHRAVQELLAQGTAVTVAGRIRARRTHGGSTFIDLADASGTIQIFLTRDSLAGEQYELLDALDLGDVIAAAGPVVQTKAGEDTVAATSWTLLTKSRTPLPDSRAGLHDPEQRARARELDLISSVDARAVIETRSTIVATLRSFLQAREFIEVETPVLQPIAGGASARPFVTHHHALDLDLTLRVSPELYLKRLVVGGLERVFEVGRSFRNEGVDRQHNPEFTTCEFYLAYATVHDLIPLTQTLFSELLMKVRGSLKFSYQGRAIDFSPPWTQVRLPDVIREQTGVDLTATDAADAARTYLEKHSLRLPNPGSPPQLLDALYKEVIRKQSQRPTIVRDFPAVMEPLAKRTEDNPTLVQCVQFIAAGMELVKAYTELNDPGEQEERFLEQEQYRAGGDADAQRIDAAYIRALQVGLPPTAGWGMGIDRLTMILTDQAHIRDVIAFPLFRPEVHD